MQNVKERIIAFVSAVVMVVTLLPATLVSAAAEISADGTTLTVNSYNDRASSMDSGTVETNNGKDAVKLSNSGIVYVPFTVNNAGTCSIVLPGAKGSGQGSLAIYTDADTEYTQGYSKTTFDVSDWSAADRNLGTATLEAGTYYIRLKSNSGDVQVYNIKLTSTTNMFGEPGESSSVIESSSVSDSSSTPDESSEADNVTNLWTGSVECGSWTGYQKISADLLADVKVGDIIRVTITVADTATEGRITVQNSSWQSISSFGHPKVTSDAPTAEFVITEDVIDIVKNGVIVKGKDVTLNSVDLIIADSDDSSSTPDESSSVVDSSEVESSSVPDSSSTPDESSTTNNITNLWIGSKAFGNWSGYEQITSSKLADVKVGDTIRVYVTDAESGAQVEIQNRNWSEIEGFGYKNVNGSYVDFNVTEGNIDVVKNGIIVKGQKATMTSVDLISSSESGDSSSTPDESSSTPDESSSTADSEVTETIWKGNVTTSGWSGGEDRTLDFGDSLNEFKSISKIEFVLESGSQFQLNWGSSPFDQYVDISTPCKYTVTDATQIQYIIDNNGISVNGDNIELTRVEVTGVMLPKVSYLAVYKDKFDNVVYSYDRYSSQTVKAVDCDVANIQGYTITGWTWTNGENSGTVTKPSDLVLLPGTTTLKAIYEVTDSTYNVTVSGGKMYVKDAGTGEYTNKVNTALNYVVPNYGLIKLVASETNADGEAFAYWMLNGMIFSYDAEIYFSAWADANFEACYEDGSITASPVAYIDKTVIKTGFESDDFNKHKITFDCAFYVPSSDVTVVNMGIIYSGASGAENLAGLQDSEGKVDVPVYCAMYKISNTSTYNNQALVSLIGSNSDRYARAYIVYEVNGTTYVKYSTNIASTAE